LPSDVFYVYEHMEKTPPDVLEFVASLYNADSVLNLFED